QDWEVKICHRSREANQAVDFLVGIGFHFPIGLHTIPTSNTSHGYFLHYDCFVLENLGRLL
ncbi:hypothetical protein LINPERHAP2_LOCUS40254, partial [Linum perenne]